MSLETLAVASKRFSDELQEAASATLTSGLWMGKCRRDDAARIGVGPVHEVAPFEVLLTLDEERQLHLKLESRASLA